MCGRFTLRTPLTELVAAFAIDEPNLPSVSPRYNIAPSQPVFAVREKPGVSPTRREAVWLRWGLIPAWAADPAIGNRMINARAETVAQKPAFRTALKRRRCLVAADGFYEWKAEGKVKQPYFIHFTDDRPFALAGMWESWETPDHSSVESCTILTTDANDIMRPIHDRMPVILGPSAYAKWLAPTELETEALRPLLAPYAGDGLEGYPVNRLVNSPRNEAPECVVKMS